MSNRILYSMGLAALLALPMACAHEQSGPKPEMMSTSDRIPAAQASVEVGDAGNGNTLLHLSAAHMAPPEKIAAGAKTYVVWVKPLAPDGKAQNLGAMQVDPNLNAALNTVTPLKNFDLWVTAEPSGTVDQPTGDKLLWARVGQ